MKKAVIFDVGGVLISAPQPVIAGYEKELGLPKCVCVVEGVAEFVVVCVI